MTSQLSDREINDIYESRKKILINQINRESLTAIIEKVRMKQYQFTDTTTTPWSNEQKSHLIESLIMNIPVSQVILYEKSYALYDVIDGNQRIKAIDDFYNNRFELIGLSAYPELEGMTYSKLSFLIRERLDRKRLSLIAVINPSDSYFTEEKLKTILRDRLDC